MITEFVSRFDANRLALLEKFSQSHPESYKDIVKAVIAAVTNPDDSYEDDNPDPDRIHVIDDGDYQGTLLFVIGAKGYQPSRYWVVPICYGSCSGCDTLQGIRDYEDGTPTAKQANSYLTLALHIVQGLKAITD